jgi:S-adenosylmethionine:tRNA ribosyltransferase-isomerase
MNLKEKSNYRLLNKSNMLGDLNHRRQESRPVSYSTSSSPPFSFMLPPELVAKEPPEHRGVSRDEVKLMVINRSNYQIEHAHFYSVGKYLRPGDLLVFNSSSTLPASLDGYLISSMGIIPIEVRLAEHLPDDFWLVLPNYKTDGLNNKNNDDDNSLLPIFEKGMEIQFGHGLIAKVYEPDDNVPRLWKVQFSKSGTQLMELLYRFGRPIRYEYVSNAWDLDYYQTVYARQPGSAEMPSAGRAFTWKLLLGLKRHGIRMAYISLHTGLSSYMDITLDLQHPASEEEFSVSYRAAEMVNNTHIHGGRVIAVGTTVVRALESVASDNGNIVAGHGYTRLHINANHKLKTVDGLLTGFHEPEASHLDLLTAFLSTDRIQKAYEEAIQRKYLWHEFGDLNLIL